MRESYLKTFMGIYIAYICKQIYIQGNLLFAFKDLSLNLNDGFLTTLVIDEF